MAKTEQQEFILAAHDLAHAAPAYWEKFMEAFDAYVGDHCIEAIQSPMETAHVARGRAQAMLALLNVLKELDARQRAIQESRSRQIKRP